MAANAFGSASRDFPAYALYDAGEGAFAVGDECGVKAGSFKLSKQSGGFKVVGAGDGTKCLVVERGHDNVTIWVKLVSKQGDGTYTVQLCDFAGVTYGPNIAGAKLSNPRSTLQTADVEPLVPSTKPFPAGWDRAGNLVFFF